MTEPFDGIEFSRDGVDPKHWPKLSCSQANQLALEVSNLRLDANREILFQDNGQLRAKGDIRFLTGDPSSSEKLTILANGNVGIGKTEPQAKLDITGTLQVEGDIQINGKSLADTIQQLTEKLEALQRDIQEKATQIDSLNREIKTTKNTLQETRRELESTRSSLTSASDNAQRTADIARSEVNSLKVGIESGSIIAQKALMLRARDDHHWMRCRTVDGANHDVFELWRNDGQWFSTIRVDAALRLSNPN